jgi:hypothetical protein
VAVVRCGRTSGGDGVKRVFDMVTSSAETPTASALPTRPGSVIAAPASFLGASCVPCAPWLGGGEARTPGVARAAAETAPAVCGVGDGAPAVPAAGGLAACPPEHLAAGPLCVAGAPAPGFSGGGTDALPSGAGCWPCAGKDRAEKRTAPGMAPAGACTAPFASAVSAHCDTVCRAARRTARRPPPAARRMPQHGDTVCRCVDVAARGKWYFWC